MWLAALLVASAAGAEAPKPGNTQFSVAVAPGGPGLQFGWSATFTEPAPWIAIGLMSRISLFVQMGARAALLEDLDVDVRLKPVQELEVRLSAGGVIGGAFTGDLGASSSLQLGFFGGGHVGVLLLPGVFPMQHRLLLGFELFFGTAVIPSFQLGVAW